MTEKNSAQEIEKAFIEKPKKAISAKFAAYISILVFMIVIFMIFYVIWTDLNIISNERINKIKIIKSFTNAIIENNADNLVKEDYKDFDNQITSLVSSSDPTTNKKPLVYVYIINHQGKIKYSTISGLAGTKVDFNNLASNKLYYESVQRINDIGAPFKAEDSNLFSRLILLYNSIFLRIFFPINITYNFLPNDDIVVIASYIVDVSDINRIYAGYGILALLFISFGFFSANVLANMVTKPIKTLYLGVRKFSQQDLSYRINIKSEDEIGLLAKNFNDMAEKLEESYLNLENKVSERTKQLEEINQEVKDKNNKLQDAYKELQSTQVKLVHSEKMSSLGQLVAGVAHELNNPINFIYGNIEHLKSYTNDLKSIIDTYSKYDEKLPEDALEEISDLKEEVDYNYLIDDLGDLLNSCKEGAERTRQIVLDLRNFSRLDESSFKEVNIHEGINSTLNILHNVYKNRIEVIKDYDETIPMVYCYAGQINQVFMNILSNAAQAIKDTGKVSIKTSLEDDLVVISFSDTGCGIPKENINKVFDPFFTTKDVGEGTGLGLSVSYGIIEKHKGTITVESKVGEGSTFTIKIPFKNPNDAQTDTQR